MKIEELEKHIEEIASKIRGIVFIAEGFSYVVIKRGKNGEYVIMDALTGDVVDMSKVLFDKAMSIFMAMEKLSEDLD